MNNILKSIKELLLSKVESIDTGNSNIDEEGLLKIMNAIATTTDMNIKVSKYKAAELLHISTSTFDNYVRLKKLPKGKHEIGFKELFWTMKDISDFKNKYWK